MGLVTCQDTIVGNQFIKGLSGGQQRRLSVAVALMKKLDIIFLDEPTTGLDSAASAGNSMSRLIPLSLPSKE
jgi:ABC-type multidrug transport system ATPase subunit